jgi:hypothetical protein
VHGEVVPQGEGEAGGEVRHLPVPAPAPDARPLDRPLERVPAPIVAATGGFLAGVATFVAVRLLRRRGSSRALGRARPRRGRELEVSATRSFLVDVHLLKR